MEKLCKNCRFWEPTDTIEAGACVRFNIIEGTEQPEPDSAVILVQVSDDHGLTVEFRTEADFGCNQFKPITETETGKP